MPLKIGAVIVFGIQVTINPPNFEVFTQKCGIGGQRIGTNPPPRDVICGVGKS